MTCSRYALVALVVSKTIVVALVSAQLVAGCSASSESDVRSEFNAYVAERNQCATSSECTTISPGCPLGCFVAVPVSQAANVEQKARDLIADYERSGTSCEYLCARSYGAICQGGGCLILWAPVDAGAE